MNYEVTPNGIITGFCALEKPSTKFNPDGIYSCQVIFTGTDAIGMKEMIDGYMDMSLREAKPKVNHAAVPPYIVDQDDQNSLHLKFKAKAIIRTKDGSEINKSPKIYDTKKNEITEPIGIGAGSIVKVAFRPYLWAVAALGAGCSLQLEMVQIINLVVSNYFNDGPPPFDAESDGYIAPPQGNPFKQEKEATNTHSVGSTIREKSTDGDF